MRLLRRFGIHAAVLGAVALCVPAISWRAHAQSEPQHQEATRADFERYMTELSNWGRWGKDDQMGAVNLITPAKRKQAAALVKEGASFSLARNAETAPAPDNPQPIVRKGSPAAPPTGDLASTGDTFFISYHGYVHTHMDSLCHFFYKGKMYNGYSRDEVTQDGGAAKNAILNFKNGIVTRGILMDIPRLKGVDYLEPGTRIYPEDLDAWEKKAHVKVGAGDVVFIRTGRWARRDAKGAWPVSQGLAGLYVTCAKWLHARDAAILGGDDAQDVLPSGIDGISQPIHVLVLVAMGMPIFDNCDLELLSKEAAKRNRWEFMISAAPAAVPFATGSVLNPIATF
ncbi:MAG TPA: cyclase family protein [Bryobacteraceae bacterium]|nr:cyclase family protein [Bryobacteraceae bacterium]